VGAEALGGEVGAMYAEVVKPSSPGRIVYDFCTAWTPPDAWLAAVSQAHPSLTFMHEFGEEFDQFAGRGEWRQGGLRWSESCSCADLAWLERSEDEWDDEDERGEEPADD
jgi:hypothetical protein